MNQYIGPVSILAASLAASSAIQAEWYLGAAEIAPARWHQLDDYSIDSSIPAFDETGMHIYSGYKASDLFSIELGYKDRMQFGVGNLFNGRELWSSRQHHIDIDSQALFLSGQGTFSIDESKHFYLRGGIYNWNIEFDNRQLTENFLLNRQGTNIFYSIGSYYDISEKFGFSAAWERFEFNHQDIDFISTQLRLNF